jgi:hypothetical protein
VLFTSLLNADTLQAAKPDVLSDPSHVVVLQQDRPEEVLRIDWSVDEFANPVKSAQPLQPAIVNSNVSPAFVRPLPFVTAHELRPEILGNIDPENIAAVRVPAASLFAAANQTPESRIILPPIVRSPGVNAMPAATTRNDGDLSTLQLNRKPVASTVSVDALEVTPTLPHAAFARAYAPSVQAVLATSDFQIEEGNALHTVVPVNAVLTPKGLPALLKVTVEATQSIPFFFVKDTNAYMFDIPGNIQPSTNHILIKLTTTLSDGSPGWTFFQDSAFRDLFYYQPQEFRLSRLPTYPYLPDLAVAFLDVVSQDQHDTTTATTHYRVELNYRALPYLDPQAEDAARAQLADATTTPRFAALEPLNSKPSALLRQPPLPKAPHLCPSVNHLIAHVVGGSSAQDETAIVIRILPQQNGDL